MWISSLAISPRMCTPTRSPVVATKHQLHQPVGEARDLRPRVRLEPSTADLDVQAALRGSLLGQPDHGHLGDRVDAQRGERIDLGLERDAEGVAHRHAPLLHAHRGQGGRRRSRRRPRRSPRPWSGTSRRRRSARGRRHLHPRRLQPEALGVADLAEGEQDLLGRAATAPSSRLTPARHRARSIDAARTAGEHRHPESARTSPPGAARSPRRRTGRMRGPAWTRVTSAPRARKIEAYSQPITPPPMTTIEAGIRSMARISSESWTSGSSNGTSGGWNGRAPGGDQDHVRRQHAGRRSRVDDHGGSRLEPGPSPATSSMPCGRGCRGQPPSSPRRPRPSGPQALQSHVGLQAQADPVHVPPPEAGQVLGRLAQGLRRDDRPADGRTAGVGADARRSPPACPRRRPAPRPSPRPAPSRGRRGRSDRPSGQLGEPGGGRRDERAPCSPRGGGSRASAGGPVPSSSKRNTGSAMHGSILPVDHQLVERVRTARRWRSASPGSASGASTGSAGRRRRCSRWSPRRSRPCRRCRT